MASRICSLVIGLDFGISLHLENDRSRPEDAFTAWRTHAGSWSAGLETSGLGIEASDPHDQRIVRIARTDDSGICLRIFCRQDDDAHTAAATSNRPLEVGYPLHAYFFRLAFQRRSESRLIRDAIILANNLVVPHRHNDSSPVIADRRPAEVPARASCTEMLERSRKCPTCFHCRCYANDVSAPEESVANNATWYLKPGSPFICRRKPPPRRCLKSQNRGCHPKSVVRHGAILHAIFEKCMLIIRYCMHKNCAGTRLAVLSVRYENQRA